MNSQADFSTFCLASLTVLDKKGVLSLLTFAVAKVSW